MPPVNDDFANATVLSGSSGHVTFSNVGATVETGEPIDGVGASAQGTVWFEWTPSAGPVEVSTSATPLPVWDSILAVYSGSSLGSLTLIGLGDDNDPQPGASGFGTSKVAWTADGTTTYRIQCGAYNDVAGPPQRSDLVLTYGVVIPPPSVSSVSPGQGEAATSVTITGTNLATVTQVTFGTADAAFTINSPTQITATVPTTSVASSTLTVTGPGGSASHAFTVLFPGPWICPGPVWGAYHVVGYWGDKQTKEWLGSRSSPLDVWETPSASGTSGAIINATKSRGYTSGEFGPTLSVVGDYLDADETQALYVVDTTTLDLAAVIGPAPPDAVTFEVSPTPGSLISARLQLTVQYQPDWFWWDDMPDVPQPAAIGETWDVRQIYGHSTAVGPAVYPSYLEPFSADVGGLLGSFSSWPASINLIGSTQPSGAVNPVRTAAPSPYATSFPGTDTIYNFATSGPFGAQAIGPVQTAYWGVQGHEVYCSHTGPIVNFSDPTAGDLGLDAVMIDLDTGFGYGDFTATLAAVSGTAGVAFGVEFTGAVVTRLLVAFVDGELRERTYDSSGTPISDTLIGTYPAFAAGDTMTVHFRQTVITIDKNGTTLDSFTAADGSFWSGGANCGLYGNSSAHAATRWSYFAISGIGSADVLYQGGESGTSTPPAPPTIDDVAEFTAAEVDTDGLIGVVVGSAGWFAGQSPQALVAANDNGYFLTLRITRVKAAAHYTPPCYRWLFPTPQILPPQREFPRDDGLGMSTRRTFPPPTSVQYGPHRGPVSSYQ